MSCGFGFGRVFNSAEPFQLQADFWPKEKKKKKLGNFIATLMFMPEGKIAGYTW